jgi:4-amino-4-deoxy-L-arabinose transferase-like glycosyltransferase
MSSRAAWWRTPSTARDLWLLGAAVVLVYLLTGDHPAFSSSTRYPEACREMVALGDWVVPHLGYVPYFEKPILTYWLGAAAQWLFGSAPLAVSLPAGIAALVSVWATYLLAVRLRGPTFALAAGLGLLGCAYFFPLATTLTTDPLLAGFLALGWWTWWRWEESGRTTGWIWGFWTALALGFMTKGLVALALPGAAIAGYAALTAGWRGVLGTLWAMHPLRGCTLIAALNLPWTVLVWQRDPRFLEFFYIRYNLGSFLSKDVNHPESWWFYLPIVPALLAPSTLIGLPALGVAAVQIWQTRSAAPDLRRFLLCVVVFPLLFLSLAQSKLGTYPLPLLPAFVILALDVLRTWEAAAGPVRRPWWSWVLAAQGALLALAVVAALCAWSAGVNAPEDWELHRLTPAGRPWVLVAISTLVGGAIASAWLGWRRRLVASAAALALTLVVMAALILPRVPLLVPDFNLTPLATTIATQATPGDQIFLQQEVVHAYELPFIVHRRFAILDGARETGMGHIAEITPPTTPLPQDTYSASGETLPGHPWLWSFARLSAAWPGSQRLWVVCDGTYYHRLQAAGLAVHLVGRANIMYLVSNQP